MWWGVLGDCELEEWRAYGGVSEWEEGLELSDGVISVLRCLLQLPHRITAHQYGGVTLRLPAASTVHVDGVSGGVGEEVVHGCAEADGTAEMEGAEVLIERLIAKEVVHTQHGVRGRERHRGRRPTPRNEVQPTYATAHAIT